MKKSELVFSAILVPVDFLMAATAILLTTSLRFDTVITDLRPVMYDLALASFFPIVLSVSLLAVVVFALAGLYAIRGTRGLLDEFGKIFLACSATVMIIIVFLFFQREFFSSRFIIIGSWVMSLVTVSVGRIGVRMIQRTLYKRGIGRQRIALIGNGKMTSMIDEAFLHHPRWGYSVVARFPDFHEEVGRELLARHAGGSLDEIWVADPTISHAESLDLIDFCQEHHLGFKYAADIFDAQATNIDVRAIAGIPIIEIKRTPLDGWGKILKRVFDLLGSSALILLISPLMIGAGVLIKLDSSGPIFFGRRDDGSKVLRIGQYGKPFWYFKLRTMKHHMDSLRYSKEFQDRNLRKGSPMVKIQNDPRITRVGRVLRRFSIDELTELFLVFMGRMSLVGPRPHLPEEVAAYQKHHKKVLSIKPGMTGLAQISGRSDLDFEEEVRLDSYYIENWTLGLDLRILLRTPLAVLRPRQAL